MALIDTLDLIDLEALDLEVIGLFCSACGGTGTSYYMLIISPVIIGSHKRVPLNDTPSPAFLK